MTKYERVSRPHNEQAGVASRLAAIKALEAIFSRGDFFDLIAGDESFRILKPEDKSLVRATVYTVLRDCDIIDAAIAIFCQKPIAPNKQEAMQAMRVGFAQIFIMKMPEHAVVDSVVSAVKNTSARYLADLVNAVLRGALRELKQLPEPVMPRTLPEWMWQSWLDAYGEEAATAAVNASLKAAPLDITVRGAKEAWARKLGGVVLSDNVIRIEARPDVANLPGYAEGIWWVQDAASSIPARLLGNISGLNVLEIGAAPGGKTAQLAAAGAKVTALDRSGKRLDKLRQNMERLKLSVDVVHADVFEYEPQKRFNAILLDAPCTATGTMRRHPEIAFIRRESDMADMVEVQSEMLDRAAGWLEVGGVMVYCVCSLQPEEGERQIDEFLSRNTNYTRMKMFGDEMPWLDEPWLTKSGDARILPHFMADKGGMDGFFIARLMRHE